MTRTIIAIALSTVTLAGCGGKDEPCLPQGERATVVRKGSDQGQRFVTLRRTNGEEVTCLGNSTPVMLSVGDEVDGWTMTKANATSR